MILAKKKLKCGDTLSVEIVGTVAGCDDPKCCEPKSEVIATLGDDYPISFDCPEKDLRNVAITLTKAADKYDAYLAKRNKNKTVDEKRRKKSK